MRKLNPSGKSPILCFVGPPGVGKTSLGQSIAKATGRKFVRVSLGGVHDEAEIRGHRRTYIGSMPGNIIQSLRKAGTRNCVMMLDEVDKLGAGGFHGDPASALLEVLDPEQNATFRDNYLGVPFDLSGVMFICTANVLDTIPGPLRDRMEIIQLPGYTAQEKLQIARRYLVARQLEATGLTAEQCEISDDALMAIIDDYTREAGVRNLEREIGNVFRNVAVRIAEGSVQQVTIGPDDLAAILGPRKFEAEVAMRSGVPGVATGLAWTPVGGDILFIEATRMPGTGKLILTGQLGDVMKESAQAALSLRQGALGSSSASRRRCSRNRTSTSTFPRARRRRTGRARAWRCSSRSLRCLTGRMVRNDVAMTGEISLRGLVLPIGGVKEKVLAALRAGITTVHAAGAQSARPRGHSGRRARRARRSCGSRRRRGRRRCVVAARTRRSSPSVSDSSAAAMTAAARSPTSFVLSGLPEVGLRAVCYGGVLRAASPATVRTAAGVCHRPSTPTRTFRRQLGRSMSVPGRLSAVVSPARSSACNSRSAEAAAPVYA